MKPTKRRRRCQHCGKLKSDVKRRPDHYARDVNNTPDATHVSCDECDQARTEDI